MKRSLTLILALAVLLALCPARAERWEEIPAALRFTQTTNARDYVKKDVLYVQSTYPTTASDAVNREMAAVIDGLEQEGRNHLPDGPYNASRPTYLDVGAYISRTGDRWMSFLSIAPSLFLVCAMSAFRAATGSAATGTTGSCIAGANPTPLATWC